MALALSGDSALIGSVGAATLAARKVEVDKAMQTIDYPRTATETAPAERQSSTSLFVVTCRANPQSADLYDSLTLGAGDYQAAWATPAQTTPTGKTPLGFSYGRWTTISHRKTPADVADILPTGDVMVVVHGFHETAPEGVYTGYAVAEGLTNQQRTGGLAAAVGAKQPTSQPGALRLAQTLQNRLPRQGQLYQQMIAFTWPCAHRLFPGYLLDKVEVARFAAFSLANLLADLRAAEPERRILLVAHSMGCFLTIKALHILSVMRGAQAAPGVSNVIVDQMVFYAADVNADALQSDLATGSVVANSIDATLITQRRNGYGYQALDCVGRLTVYYSFHDNALVWSPFANVFSEESSGWAGRARLGWCGPYDITLTHKSVVAVDCSACIFDHAAYFIRHEILEDTARRLAEPAPARPQPACLAPALPTTAEGTQPRARRLWTWYTPAEIARERWERFFLYKPRWLRRIGFVLGLLLLLDLIAAILYGLAELIL